MSDYISRDAAIADFEYCTQENSTWTPQRVKTLLMRITSADVVPVRRWIPCSERMPENHDVWEQYNVVYCTYRPNWIGDDDEYVEDKRVLSADYNREQKMWRICGSGEIINALILNDKKAPWISFISHWMPLPEPPEEERNETD